MGERQLTLVKPKKWDDPFENALLASTFETSNGERTSFAAKNSIYGQCWTLHRETDAMWRIYSHQKDGVRIASTPRKLFSALCRQDSESWKVRCFIGRVSYHGTAELLKALSRVYLLDPNGSGFAESLLYKRREFAHEREIRLICSDQDADKDGDTYSFAIDPDELFDRITFDPRMDPELRNAYRLAIKAKGFKNRVTTSSLYQAPQGLVFSL